MLKRNVDTITPQATIFRGSTEPRSELAPGISLQMLVSGNCGAPGLCTSLAAFEPGAVLAYHQHEFSEAITVLEGCARVFVQGRSYLLDPLDCIHVPRRVPHLAANVSRTNGLKLLSAFANSQPTRELVYTSFLKVDRERRSPEPADPEHIQRFAQTEGYDLSEGVRFVDLFAGRLGSVGICGGYGEFAQGTSLPCHSHDFGESISIIRGEAICQAARKQHSLESFDTAFIPQGCPHRFLNESNEVMAMIWIYGGNEPTRKWIESGYCCETGPRNGSQIEESEVIKMTATYDPLRLFVGDDWTKCRVVV